MQKHGAGTGTQPGMQRSLLAQGQVKSERGERTQRLNQRKGKGVVTNGATDLVSSPVYIIGILIITSYLPWGWPQSSSLPQVHSSGKPSVARLATEIAKMEHFCIRFPFPAFERFHLPFPPCVDGASVYTTH